MIQMLFFLRFKPQLRRISPEKISPLEETVAEAVRAAGGRLIEERRLLAASFDEASLGFWLDMLILVETVLKTMEDAAPDIYGYTLILGRGVGENSPERLCQTLSSGAMGGGVWLDNTAKKGLFPYVQIEKPEITPESRAGAAYIRDRSLIRGFVRLKALKNISGIRSGNFPLEETILRALKQGPRQNALLTGPDFSGKRHGLYRFCGELWAGQAEGGEDFSPLSIRFGSGRHQAGGLRPLADAWSPSIRKLIVGKIPAESLDEMDQLGEQIFREGLRDDISPYMMNQGRRFFKLLMESYIQSAKKRGLDPIVIFENIHAGEETAVGIFPEIIAGFSGIQDLLILGTCSGESPDIENRLKMWEDLFPRVIKLKAGGITEREIPELSPELWEIAYTLALLGRYFPGTLFRRLFEEEGKNPAMLSRALSLLTFLGLVDIPEDPRPRMRNFISRAEEVLGDRKEKVRLFVRNRLLAWVDRNKLSPCYRLLEALADLGGGAEDDLILKSVSSDIINGTGKELETAFSRGRLGKMTGPDRNKILLFIIKTLQALNHGNEGQIRSAFQGVPPECGFSPVLKAQILVNLSGYYLGVRDAASAGETVKEGIILSQGKNSFTLAQSYRLFSLVNLSRQRTGEAIDYLGFAVDNAEKAGDPHELAVSAYYAASAQFLFGNISKALRFARQAEEQAAASGSLGWADRSRFLRGRLCFETGRYREALEIFDNLRKNPFGPPEREQLINAWVYRAKVYFQNPLIQKPPEGGPDADLFEIEAAYLAGNYEKTAELSGALAGPHADENFLYIEQPDWRSGFAQAELLLFSRKDLWDRMISVYHSLAKCRLSPSGGEEAVHAMQRIFRDERLSEIDPWDAFYFFAWYRVLEETGAAQVDMNTAVSMAFKRLQRRASRIDDVEIRRDFLFLSRWNASLSLAAREYKLI